MNGNVMGEAVAEKHVNFSPVAAEKPIEVFTQNKKELLRLTSTSPNRVTNDADAIVARVTEINSKEPFDLKAFLDGLTNAKPYNPQIYERMPQGRLLSSEAVTQTNLQKEQPKVVLFEQPMFANDGYRRMTSDGRTGMPPERSLSALPPFPVMTSNNLSSQNVPGLNVVPLNDRALRPPVDTERRDAFPLYSRNSVRTETVAQYRPAFPLYYPQSPWYPSVNRNPAQVVYRPYSPSVSYPRLPNQNQPSTTTVVAAQPLDSRIPAAPLLPQYRPADASTPMISTTSYRPTAISMPYRPIVPANTNTIQNRPQFPAYSEVNRSPYRTPLCGYAAALFDPNLPPIAYQIPLSMPSAPVITRVPAASLPHVYIGSVAPNQFTVPQVNQQPATNTMSISTRNRPVNNGGHYITVQAVTQHRVPNNTTESTVYSGEVPASVEAKASTTSPSDANGRDTKSTSTT